MDRDAIQAGFSFEERFAKKVGGQLVPGSGNRWFAKLDVGSKKFLWSLKHTTKKSFALTNDLWKEVQAALYGPGGHGSDFSGGIVVSIQGRDYVVMPVDDFVELVTEEVKIVPPTKVQEKRARANRNLLG